MLILDEACALLSEEVEGGMCVCGGGGGGGGDLPLNTNFLTGLNGRCVYCHAETR